MRTRALMWPAATILVLGGLYVLFRSLAPAREGRPPQATAYRLSIRDQRLVSGPTVLEAFEGDAITIVVTSNRVGTLHVHEYEQTVVLDLEPGREAARTFTADRSGRFGVHLISPGNLHAEVAALEVRPR